MEHRMMDARFYQAQGMTQKEIAEALGVTDRTVRNYLSERPRPRIKPIRKSNLDPFRDYVRSTIEQNIGMNGELIYDSIRKMGYAGKRSVLKEYITKVRRDNERQAVIRFETEPGFQAQVDWVEFGKQMVDGEPRKLYAFTMVLGYSRLPFVRFTTNMASATLLACHEDAFRHFGGIPAEILIVSSLVRNLAQRKSLDFHFVMLPYLITLVA
jgi:transposase